MFGIGKIKTVADPSAAFDQAISAAIKTAREGKVSEKHMTKTLQRHATVMNHRIQYKIAERNGPVPKMHSGNLPR